MNFHWYDSWTIRQRIYSRGLGDLEDTWTIFLQQFRSSAHALIYFIIYFLPVETRGKMAKISQSQSQSQIRENESQSSLNRTFNLEVFSLQKKERIKYKIFNLNIMTSIQSRDVMTVSFVSLFKVVSWFDAIFR